MAEKHSPLNVGVINEKIKNGQVKIIKKAKPRSIASKEGPADEVLHKADIEEDKPEKSKGKAKAQKKEAVEPVTEFPCKLNKYGFISVRKAARPHLPFEAEEPLKAKIEGDALIITKA